MYQLVKKRTVIDARIKEQQVLSTAQDSEGEENPVEKFYCDLLDLFARDLHSRDISLIMISVNAQLNNFPLIRQKVTELHQAGYMHYIEIVPWFEGVEDFGSPEGHSWGVKAHKIIGNHLAEYIENNYLSKNPAASPSPKP
jgi:hypothetical protein